MRAGGSDGSPSGPAFVASEIVQDEYASGESRLVRRGLVPDV